MTDPLHPRVEDALRLSDARDAVPWLVRTLEEHGFDTWAVGGSVRDALRGHPDPKADWDFATAARPSDVQKTFRRTVPVGIDHGTVGVLKNGKMYEVTTFRRDVEPLGRRAIVQFADTLGEDLARRDFTINAIAWHPLRGEVQDPFGGAKDLEDNVLRAVGSASERFREDYLRILRGLRFAGKLGLAVDSETWTAMTQAVDGLPTLSWERVREELVKVMASTAHASTTLELYHTSGALAAILAELSDAAATPTLWARTLATVDRLTVGDPVLRIAALLLPVARQHGVEAVLATLERLRFSNAETERVSSLVAPPWDLQDTVVDPVTARRWAASAKSEHRRGRLRLAAAEADARQVLEGASSANAARAIRAVREEMQSGHALSVSELEVDGRDLIRLGLRPGPQIGEVLRGLLDRVLESPELNSQERLLEQAAALIAEAKP